MVHNHFRFRLGGRNDGLGAPPAPFALRFPSGRTDGLLSERTGLLVLPRAHASCGLGDGDGRTVGGQDNETAEGSPGEQGAQEMFDAG